MDIKEEKTAKSHDSPIEEAEIAEKENEVIVPPTIESHDSSSHDKAQNPTPVMVIEAIKEVYTDIIEIQQTEKDQFKCRPVAFLLGLPFALISLVISLVGCIIWIIGIMLTCICPCCFCVTLFPTMLVEMALELVNVPFDFFHYITDKIPF